MKHCFVRRNFSPQSQVASLPSLGIHSYDSDAKVEKGELEYMEIKLNVRSSSLNINRIKIKWDTRVLILVTFWITYLAPNVESTNLYSKDWEGSYWQLMNWLSKKRIFKFWSIFVSQKRCGFFQNSNLRGKNSTLLSTGNVYLDWKERKYQVLP